MFAVLDACAARAPRTGRSSGWELRGWSSVDYDCKRYAQLNKDTSMLGIIYIWGISMTMEWSCTTMHFDLIWVQHSLSSSTSERGMLCQGSANRVGQLDHKKMLQTGLVCNILNCHRFGSKLHERVFLNAGSQRFFPLHITLHGSQGSHSLK